MRTVREQEIILGNLKYDCQNKKTVAVLEIKLEECPRKLNTKKKDQN